MWAVERHRKIAEVSVQRSIAQYAATCASNSLFRAQSARRSHERRRRVRFVREKEENPGVGERERERDSRKARAADARIARIVERKRKSPFAKLARDSSLSFIDPVVLQRFTHPRNRYSQTRVWLPRSAASHAGAATRTDDGRESRLTAAEGGARRGGEAGERRRSGGTRRASWWGGGTRDACALESYVVRAAVSVSWSAAVTCGVVDV